MRKKIVICLILLFLLCGCAYSEPNEKYTVTAIGFSVDSSENKVFLQARNLSSGEQNGSTEIFTMQGNGKDFSSAINDIRSRLDKEPSFEHCQVIIVSQKVERKGFEEILKLCCEKNISLRTRLVSSRNVDEVLAHEKSSKGAGLAALLKQNAKTYGYGAHTAIFEIQTALLSNDGNFALPILESEKFGVKVSGLCRYSDGNPGEILGVEESIDYAKEMGLYEGENK